MKRHDLRIPVAGTAVAAWHYVADGPTAARVW